MSSQRSLCQVAPYGGVDRWIKLALKEFPETKKLMVLVNRTNSEESEKYFNKAEAMLRAFSKENEKMPEEKKILNEMFVIKKRMTFYELVYLFRSLFKELYKEGYDAVVNLSNGLQAWKTALYVASLDSPNVTMVFLIDKETGNISNFWKHRNISPKERLILDILKKRGVCTLSEIQKEFFEIKGKGKLSFVSTLINKMANSGLLEFRRMGREARISITSVGIAYSFTTPVEEMEYIEIKVFGGD